MKRRTLDSLDKVECLLYAIRRQNNRVLPSILRSKPEQLQFWEKVICSYKNILSSYLWFDDIEQIRMFIRRSGVIEDIDILGGILFFRKKPDAWDPENIRKIDPDFYNEMMEAASQIEKISREKVAPAISGVY